MAREDRKWEGKENEEWGLEKREEVKHPSCKYSREELEMEILLRFPAKSLLRFRCVCKRWCRLFSTHKFMSDHVRTFNVDQDLLLAWRLGCFPEKRYPLYSDDRYPEHPTRLRDLVPPLSKTDYSLVKPVGYCNGVVCLRCVGPPLERKVDIVIWNPSINKSVVVPVPRVDSSPAWFMTAVAFGFTGDDLKLVTLPSSLCDGRPIELGMYSLRTGNWEKVAAASDPRSEVRNLCPGMRFPNGDAVFLNHSCHWYIEVERQVGKCFIMSFNLVDKVIRKIALPNGLRPQGRGTCYNRISVYDGCLAVSGIRSHPPLDDSESDLFVWVMKEYGNAESWTRIVYGQVPRPLHHIVGFRKGGGVIYTWSNSKLASYDPVIQGPRYFAKFSDLYRREAYCTANFSKFYGEEAYCTALCQMDFYKESLFLLE